MYKGHSSHLLAIYILLGSKPVWSKKNTLLIIESNVSTSSPQTLHLWESERLSPDD